MKIAIIVAMEKELALLLPLLENITEEEVNGFRIINGRMGHHEVSLMQTGIGKVNAAVGAVTLIDRCRPDVMLNTGVAGGTGAAVLVGDAVIADRVAYHDVFCPDNAPGQVQGMPDEYRCEVDGIVNLAAAEQIAGVHRGVIASGDVFVSTPEELQRVLAVRPEALAVDMESGAIAQVCHIKGVPFLAIRVVSDTPGIESHYHQYNDFFAQAPRSTFAILEALLS